MATVRGSGIIPLAEALHPYPPSITFKKIRVHWENLIIALREAGFDIVEENHSIRKKYQDIELDKKEMEFLQWMEDKKTLYGIYPPRHKSDKHSELEYFEGWGIEHGVPRSIIPAWVAKHGLKQRPGNPGKLAKNKLASQIAKNARPKNSV